MFDPSEKQLCALANMERFAGIGSNRTQFATHDEFSVYWQRISDRCDQQRQQMQRRQAQGEQGGQSSSAARAQQRQRKQQKIDAYYQNKDVLLRYAEKYKNRYQPAREKIERQLHSKCSDHAIVTAVMQILEPQINDAATALERASRMQAQGKNVHYIKTNLRQRFYDTACIKDCITALTYTSGSIWSEETLERRIQQMQRQGKSTQHILQTLCENPNDKALVETALQHADAADKNLENLKHAYHKLLTKNIQPDKIIKRLLSKGFRYVDICSVQQKEQEKQ